MDSYIDVVGTGVVAITPLSIRLNLGLNGAMRVADLGLLAV